MAVSEDAYGIVAVEEGSGYLDSRYGGSSVGSGYTCVGLRTDFMVDCWSLGVLCAVYCQFVLISVVMTCGTGLAVWVRPVKTLLRSTGGMLC